MLFPLALALACIAPGFEASAIEVGVEVDEEVRLVEEIGALGDNADPALLVELADFGTPDALNGLVGLLERMGSVYMRREVLRSMERFLDIEKTRPDTLEHLAKAATEEFSPELRSTAVDALCGQSDGREFLIELVLDKDLRMDVRFELLEGLVKKPLPDEVSFLKKVYSPRKGDLIPDSMRTLAYETAVPWLSGDELMRGIKEDTSGIRLAALGGLEARGDKRLASTAQRIFENRRAGPPERLQAGRMWLDAKGSKVAKRMLEEIRGREVSEELAFGVADMLSEAEDESIDRFILRLFKNADSSGMRLLLRAGRRIQQPTVDRAFLASLESKDPRLVREAIDGIGARRQKGAKENLKALIRSDQDGWYASVAIEALGGWEGGEKWEANLALYADDLRSPVRYAALRVLAKLGSPTAEASMAAAVEYEGDWVTRSAGLRGVETMRSKLGVGALCRQIGKEDGRLLEDMAGVLWRLTGQPFQTNTRAWARWWEENEETFSVISKEDLEQLEAEREERLLRRTSIATFKGRDGAARFVTDLDSTAFFGFKVVSRRVVFAIDVSTSMDEYLTFTIDDDVRSRLDLARRELHQIIGLLDPETRFRLITFSGMVNTWVDELSEATPENVAAAQNFVGRLAGAPATNFYDTLRLAFADPTIDTIYLLSDGEPTHGDVTDTTELRRIVREWNRFRGIKLHCIAVGSDLGLLRHLAEDSGGFYAFYP